MPRMGFVVGVVSDLHFGPEARYEGKLRKLTHRASELTKAFVVRMNTEVRPDLVVNLGDDIEDENREADLARYGECQALLRTCEAELVNVAGNHDTVNLNRDDLSRFWQREGPLYYSLDRGGYHLVVLHTLEKMGERIQIPAPQRTWLEEDLARAELPAVVFMHHSAAEQDLSDSRWFRGRPHAALVEERQELRAILKRSGRVRAVFNGHVHRNHLDVIDGIPYVTFQSLIENLDDDAPGRPAAAHGVIELLDGRIVVRVHGNDPARYQFEL